MTNSLSTADNPPDITFIIGLPRTGSKIYKNIINYNSPIHISQEIFFLTPRWIRKDVVYHIKNSYRNLFSDQDIEKFVDDMYTNRFFGTYWRNFEGDKEQLKQRIAMTDRSLPAVFKSILEYDASKHHKKSIGAKFPVHITKAQTLYEWFPLARFIHIDRNPLAIYSSQKRKHLKNSKNFISKASTLVKVFMATVLSHHYSRKFFLENQSHENYILIKYEDLVTDPTTHIKRLCTFLRIQFNENMLNPPVIASSYTSGKTTDSKVTGFPTTSIDKWKSELSGFEINLIRLFTARFG